MKKIVFFLFLLFSLTSQAQNKFPSVDSLQNYTYRYVKNSSVESFTNLRLQNILIGLSQMVDTLRNAGYVDSIWIGADDTLKYRIGNTTFKVGKISGGGSSYSFTYPLQLNTGIVSLDTTKWHSFPFYNTQYRPITWVPTLQEVTTQGNTTDANIELIDGATLVLTNSTVSYNKGSFNTQLDVVIPTQGNNILFPNNSGTVLLNADTSSMLSPYLRSNVAAATYQPIGSYLTTATLTDSLNTNGVTGITLNTPNVIFSTPVTFNKTGRAWSGTLSLNTQSANTILAGPTTGSAAAPTFRALVAADIPDLSSSYVTTTTYNNAVLDSGWVDISNTSTIVGWSSFTTKVLKYRRIGKSLYVKYSIAGTSNSTTTSFTVPYTSVTVGAGCTHYIVNNGTPSIGYPTFGINSNVIEFVRFSSLSDITNSWTAWGTKQISGFVIIEIN